MLRSLLLLALAAAVFAAAPPLRADELAEVQKLQAAGDPRAALARVEQALVAHPRDPQLRFLSGVLLSELGRRDEAMAIFVQLNEEYPQLPDPLNNIAVLHAAAGRLDAARAALEAALRNDSKHRAARENLGDVYVRLAARQWEALQAEHHDPAVTRKLRLARELLHAP